MILHLAKLKKLDFITIKIMKTPFNVIIENNGKFEPYDIMQYLKGSWDYDKSHKRTRENLPTTMHDLETWVDNKLKYQYWGRCEYEIILSCWPPHPDDKAAKWDIYMQCKMNLPIIAKIFAENYKIKIESK